MAGHAEVQNGGTAGVFDLYGKNARKPYRTFVAVWRQEGTFRVLPVDEPCGWVAFLCTDLSAN